MEQTRQVSTNVAAPGVTRAPMGHLLSQRTYPDASFRDVTAPNADTLYTTAWMDLSKEPYVLHVPAMGERFYLMPVLDGWTGVIADPGTRTGAIAAQDYVITGPNWRGSLPAGLAEIKSPTNLVWLIGRIYSTGTPEDYEAVHSLQDQMSLQPLSAFGKTHTPPPGRVDPSIDTKTATRDQVDRMDTATYFTTLARLMEENPPSPEDAPIVARMATIGIVPGQPFDPSRLDPAVRQALTRVPRTGQQRIKAHANAGGVQQNGWLVTFETGRYGTDYLQRAYIAAIGLGANLPEDAVYPTAMVDGRGQRLTGSRQYRIHFSKGQSPPVDGFWSITMYDSQMFFVKNPLNKYTVSPRDNLEYNPDGSLDIYVQHQSPGKAHAANWLPAPQGDFVLTMRMYWPKPPVLDQTWKVPPIEPSSGAVVG